jgi:hypothetical protein
MGNVLADVLDPAEALYPGGPSKAQGNDPVGDENFRSAMDKMNLTPQEQYLYKMHLTNLTGKGGVDNPDGSRSSLYQTVQEHEGRFYNIPTVWNGKIETEKFTNKAGKVFDVANKTALDNVDKIGWDKFPSYATAEEADSRYDEMHSYMEKDTARYLQSRH